MIKETFRRIEFSDEQKFVKTDNKIELKEYTDDLLFLLNFNGTFNAEYSFDSPTPTITGNPEIADFDAFGFTQHCNLKGSLTYIKENFSQLTNEGTISFWLSPGFDNAQGEQTFVQEEPNVISLSALYGFEIFIDGVSQGKYSFTLNPNDTKAEVFNGISTVLSTNNIEATTEYATDGRIKIKTTQIGKFVEIKDSDEVNVNSLIDLMGGVEEPILPNGPTTAIEFFKLQNANNKNSISLTHTTDSHILLRLYDKDGNLVIDEDTGVWSSITTNYYNFELNFNDNIGQFFIDGKLKSVFITNFSREAVDTELVLQGIDDTDYHKIDEVIIKTTYTHNKNFEPATEPLMRYATDKPYIDIFFDNGFKEQEVKDIIIKASQTGTHYVVKIANTWYYYASSAWRISDGSFNQSNTIAEIEAHFAELYFNENYDLEIRVFFESDGNTQVWIDEISIIIEEGSSSSATIVGTVSLEQPVDLSTDMFVEISTDQDSAIVDVSSAALDVSSVSLEEIKQAINDAHIPGLAPATDDGNYHLVLQSTNEGSDALVQIGHAPNNSALPIIWDTEGSTDVGEDTEIVTDESDYSEIYRYVRSKLGAPLVPVELTDEQLDDCIASAVYNYNKWRNFKEKLEFVQLKGNPTIGYEIPPTVGGEENITEIVFETEYPVNYYVGNDELLKNIYVQEIFKNNDIVPSAADYHISLVASKDLGIILGTGIKYEFINRRLFLYPSPPTSLRIGIKYKAAMTLSEIVNSQPIKDFVLAEAKIILGNIRSTFGNQIPGGDGMLQLNGSELKTEGQQEKEALLASWKSSTNVYEFIIG